MTSIRMVAEVATQGPLGEIGTLRAVEHIEVAEEGHSRLGKACHVAKRVYASAIGLDRAWRCDADLVQQGPCWIRC